MEIFSEPISFGWFFPFKTGGNKAMLDQIQENYESDKKDY